MDKNFWRHRIPTVMPLASGCSVWALVHPKFGSSANPIITRGADYATLLLAHPDLKTKRHLLWVRVKRRVQQLDKIGWYNFWRFVLNFVHLLIVIYPVSNLFTQVITIAIWKFNLIKTERHQNKNTSSEYIDLTPLCQLLLRGQPIKLIQVVSTSDLH